MINTAHGRPRPRRSDKVLLIDRCLPPELARELSKVDGLYSVSLTEHYGDEKAQAMADVEFLADAGDAGWGVVTQNPHMWRVPHERQCIIDHGTRVFSLDDANTSKVLKGLVFGRHLLSVRRRLHREDACFWRLRLQGIRRDRR